MPDESLMPGERPLPLRWEFLRASFARRADPYAGADVQSARRLVPLLVLLNVLLTAAFLPMAPPDDALGDAGWALAGAIVLAELITVRVGARRGRRVSFDELRGVAYGGVAGVGVLEWFGGGPSPYMMLSLLGVGAGVGVHPP